MALSKIGTEALEHISSSANATYLTVDASEQIAVSSEGGAVTTSLQQGLIKHFVNMDAGTTINDSFNTASITDNGTGNHASTLTNAMGNSNYVVTGSNIGSGLGGDSGEIFISNQTAHTTTKYEFRTRNSNTSYYDNYVNQLHLSGDLA